MKCEDIQACNSRNALTPTLTLTLTQGSMAALDPGMQLKREDIRACKAQALARVRVPATVIQLITDLRTFLQVRCACAVVARVLARGGRGVGSDGGLVDCTAGCALAHGVCG